MAKIGVLILHGMGNQQSDFAEAMIERLARKLLKQGFSRSDIIWEPVFWAPVFQGKETELLRKMKSVNDLHYTKLRAFAVSALADAISYQKVPSTMQHINVYQEINDKIKSGVSNLRYNLQQSEPDVPGKEYPLIVMAHSLGCQMLSNYIWDVQHALIPVADNPFEKMETLVGIITFGNNMPLFTIVYNDLVPITFPGISVDRFFPKDTEPGKLHKALVWLNFYDPDDVLGYPLKPLSAAYNQTVSADVPIKVGGLLTRWNPLCHSEYWCSGNFIKPVAQCIGNLLTLL